MLNEFLKYIKDNRLINKNNRVLLAVSGGIDSMVMSDLFIRAGINIGIAHCNFTLRAEESDKDEEMVGEFAANHNIPFYFQRFDTKAFAEKKKISIQMAARELRYEWFEKIRAENGFDKIAVAHNLNDNIETLLINLTRGTGLSGLTGMKSSGGHIIRPLLFATRNSIEEYCKNHGILYREDHSNAETKYTRNKIRHLVIPLLKDINPSIEFTLNETAERLSGISEVLSDYTKKIREKSMEVKENIIVVKIRNLEPYMENRTILFELFKPFGITGSTIKDLKNVMSGRSGGHLLTETYRIMKNRDELIISDCREEKNETFILNNFDDLVINPLISDVEIINLKENFSIPHDQDIACLDLDKLTYPMTIRKWHPGDLFYPLGMTGKKKLSDYFVDRKFSVLQKEKSFILESEGKIVWLLGERIDNRFRITGSTKKALIMRHRAQSTGQEQLTLSSEP